MANQNFIKEINTVGQWVDIFVEGWFGISQGDQLLIRNIGSGNLMIFIGDEPNSTINSKHTVTLSKGEEYITPFDADNVNIATRNGSPTNITLELAP